MYVYVRVCVCNEPNNTRLFFHQHELLFYIFRTINISTFIFISLQFQKQSTSNIYLYIYLHGENLPYVIFKIMSSLLTTLQGRSLSAPHQTRSGPRGPGGPGPRGPGPWSCVDTEQHDSLNWISVLMCFHVSRYICICVDGSPEADLVLVHRLRVLVTMVMYIRVYSTVIQCRYCSTDHMLTHRGEQAQTTTH